MSDIMNMRRLLNSDGGLSSPLSSEAHDSLLKGHIEATSNQSITELQMLREALQAVAAQSDASTRVRAGEAVLRNLSSIRPLSSVRAASYERIIADLADCTPLAPPQFTIQTPEQEVRNAAGDLMQFTRANASAGTLEAVAATGEVGPEQWPSSETFFFGFNRSQASIGGILTVPPHGQGAVLTVTAELRVEHINALNPANPYSDEPASSLAYTIGGDPNLPFGGVALAYCWLGLYLHGAPGSHWTVVDLIDKASSISDENYVRDSAPGGIIGLINTVALAPETSMLSVFVDARCFAGVEESDELRSGFALFECRDKPIPERDGIYRYPARLHLREVTACLYELPVLLPHRTPIEST
jgi:hypothetical protein